MSTQEERDQYNRGLKQGLTIQTERVYRLQKLLLELGEHVFEIDENDRFTSKDRNTSLPHRINIEIDQLTREVVYGPRMIPITDIKTELEGAERMAFETAILTVENLKIKAIITEERKHIIEYLRRQFLIVLQKLLDKETE